MIDKYLDGSASAEQERELYEWISASEENLAAFTARKRAHDRFGILTARADSLDEARRKVMLRIARRSLRRMVSGYVAAAAAAAVIVVGLFALDRMSGTTLPNGGGMAWRTERGEQKVITLPDGSTVALNADSRLSYVFEQGRGLRQVYLTGEAFFDVVRDTLTPFVVRTDHVDARVLGTSFNMSAYPDDRIVETTIKQGRVALSIHGSQSGGVEVTANDRATLLKGTDGFRVDRVDQAQIAGWIDGRLVFREAWLGDIAGELERRYDIRVTLADEVLRSMVYTATFDKGTPIEQVLDMLARTSPIEYDITRQGVVIRLKTIDE